MGRGKEKNSSEAFHRIYSIYMSQSDFAVSTASVQSQPKDVSPSCSTSTEVSKTTSDSSRLPYSQQNATLFSAHHVDVQSFEPILSHHSFDGIHNVGNRTSSSLSQPHKVVHSSSIPSWTYPRDEPMQQLDQNSHQYLQQPLHQQQQFHLSALSSSHIPPPCLMSSAVSFAFSSTFPTTAVSPSSCVQESSSSNVQDQRQLNLPPSVCFVRRNNSIRSYDFVIQKAGLGEGY